MKNKLKQQLNIILLCPQVIFTIKVAFLSALIVHLYNFTNLITNHDDVAIRYVPGYD